MKVISFVAQKGGVGKSTLAISCAVAAYQQGQNVLILDMDPQGSVESWYQDRSEDAPGVVCITAPKMEQAITAASERDFDLVVIDTPGRDTPGIAAAIKVSDLVIIPCRPSVTDMKAIPTTFAMVHRLNKQAAFVLSQTPVATLARGSRIREAEAGLSMLGMAAPVPIVSRLAYQDAHGLGLGVTEYEPNGKAAAEITRLWNWITTKLEKTTDETHKRTSLEAVLGTEIENAPLKEVERAPTPVKPKSNKKQKSVIMHMEVFNQLRVLAFEENRPMHFYLIDGLDRVFADRGLPSVASLEEKSD